MKAKKKKVKFKKLSKKIIKLKVKVNLDKSLGAAHRDQYLDENPHGFRKVNKVHKNKKKYARKSKHAKSLKKDLAFFCA